MRTTVVFALVLGLASSAVAQEFTTATVPSDGVYKFAFGSGNKPAGYTHVETNDIYDAAHQYADTTPGSGTYTYGFLGTTEDSYKTDIPWSLTTDARMIDGFSVVMGQYVQLREEAQGVAGPLMADYMPSGASEYEGRYPVRFSFSAEQEAYYAVTCTVVNVSATETADVTLFSERCHIIAHHMTLAAGETRTFAWSVELFPNYSKGPAKYYMDDAINVVVVGKNAGLKELVAVKQPQKSGTIRGVATEKMNVGKTMWLCDDSTGTDQANATPYFSLQNYSGVGSGLSRWAPANLSIRNQGEGGLATGAKEHRKSCMLKPGDYLYVEYGHNESGTASYTNNLEVYLQDANDAGAYLLIVSPVERRSDWNKETQSWNRSLGGYATAGEAWVEDKIAQRYTNVAFIDLNKTYNDWMNREIVRVHDKNTKISLNAAINFYYRSAKGANVDNTHINNAGTDQAAYWVWCDATNRVAKGKTAGATQSEQVQAAVLEGITTGYQGMVGINGSEANVAWSVTDDIIAEGAAPNSFWDTPVTAGYDYVNDAVVESIGAVANSDGSVTLSNVTMRILNPGNYYKAVVEVVNAAGTTTNTYYSYYNYDVGGAGKMSGDLVTPNEPGFIDGDRDKDDVKAADRQTIEIPSGSTAHAWIAVADDSTWQVGTNQACSAKYPIEWWSQVILEDPCASTDKWVVNSAAVWTTNIVDGAIYFTSTGADSGNNKKNFGIRRVLDADVTSGRYRIAFKAMIDAGSISYVLGDSPYKTTTMLFNNSVQLMKITTGAVVGYKDVLPLVTVSSDGNKMPQARANASRWVDVDLIVDRDNARAMMSVGGSDYVTWRDTAFLPESFGGRTWKYFGITTPGQTSTYGYVKDVKIVRIKAVTYPTFTVKAASSDATLGSVTINGYAVNSLKLYSGSDVMLSAKAANQNFYKFSGWTDAQSAAVSSKANLFYPAQTADLDLTADFAAYGNDEDRVLTWDFSNYAGSFAVSNTATTVADSGLSFVMTTGEALTTNGLKWANSSNSGTDKSLVDNKYITYTPTANGTFSLTFSADAFVAKRDPTVLINAATSKSDCAQTNSVASKSVTTPNTAYTLTYDMTAGQTYYIWPYSYNWSGAKFYHNYTVSSITYTYPPLVTLTVPAVENASVKVTANGTVVTPETSTALTNTYAITMGSAVTVAYTSVRPGYIISNGTISYPSFMTDTTVDTSSVISVEAYTWTGLAGDGLWTTPNNWNYAGSVPDNAPAYCADDLVGFDQDAVVDVGSTNVYDGANLYVFNDAEVELKSSTTGNMALQNVNCPITLNATTTANWAVLNNSYTVDSTLTLKGRWRFAYHGSILHGDGRLVLKDCTLYGVGSDTSRQDNAIDIPVELSTGSTITMNINSSKKGYCKFNFKSSVTGGGTVIITSGDQDSWSGPNFYGDMSRFTGRVTWTTTKGNAFLLFGSSATDMSASAWSICYNSGVVSTGGDPFSAISGWYELGALDIAMPSKYVNDIKLRIGTLNEDSHLTGTYVTGATREIDWIAPTATLHTALLNVNTLSVTGGGTVNFAEPKTGVASTNGIPLTALTFADQGGYVVCHADTFSAVTNAIKNSTAPIGFVVAAGEKFELDPAMLDASNVQVFRKAGEGTLSVAENTLFTNLTDRIKRTITITDLPEGKRVAFETVDGCEKAVVADAFTDLEFDIGSGVTSNHVGTITGASNLVKKGDGTLVLIGNNSFEGAVTVNAGTLKLGDYVDMDGVLADYDASRTDLMTFTTSSAGEQVLATLGDASGKLTALTNPNSATDGVITNNATIFGGRTYLDAQSAYLKTHYATFPTNTFMVYKAKSVGNYFTLAKRDDSEKKGSIATRNDSAHTIWWRTGQTDYNSLAGGIYMNGVADSDKLTTDATVLNIETNWVRSTSTWVQYANSAMYFGELLTFDRNLTDTERTFVTDRLMTKWGIQDGSYAVLPTSADITVAAGATLDLGTQVSTVMTVTLESGATLKLDKVADDGVILNTSIGSASELSGVTVILNGKTVVTGSDDDEYTLTQTAEGLVMTKNPPPTFTWVGEAGASWAETSSWQRNGKTPSRLPGAEDLVMFPDGASVALGAENRNAYNITANGSLTLTGTCNLNVGSNMTVAGTLTLTPVAADSTIVAAHNGYSFKLAIGDALTATTLSGAATIEADGGVVTSGASTFYGTIEGGAGLTLNGGVTELQGPNTFAGTLEVNAGTTLKFGNRITSLGIKYGFDATKTNGWTIVDGTNVNIYTYVNDNGKAVSWTQTLCDGYMPAVYCSGDADHFGGKPYLQFNGSYYKNSTKLQGLSYLFVAQPDVLGGRVVTYDSNKDYIAISGTSWIGRNNGNSIDWSLFVNGTTTRTATANVGNLVAGVARTTASNNRWDGIGLGYVGALAEVIGFSSTISLEDRRAGEMWLANKWNLDCKSTMQPIPASASVVVADGATLDLGVFVGMRTGAVTLASGSTIAVDALPGDGVLLTTANAISLGENITIKVGGAVMKPYRLKVRDNGDGTYSLIAFFKRGLFILFE